ncbi:MAG TPA: hypothetical protein VEV43_01605 [Actinomycetota bacterium]|nr:hypothetical protein [Actinomycetota bacterium]
MIARRRPVLELAGIAWTAAAALVVLSLIVRRETSLSSAIASTIQVAGVVMLVAAVLGILWGLVSLARVLSWEGDLFGAGVLWAWSAGIVLLPLLFLGAYLLLPALVALIVRGRLGGIAVRLPAVAVVAGLATAGVGLGWPEGARWTVLHYAVSFLGASVEGAALIWFGRKTDSSSRA